MTKRGFYGFFIAGSLIFNVVFVVMWMAQAMPRHMTKHNQCGTDEICRQSCALQKALDMNDSQWALLKPRIESYRAKTASLSDEIARRRATLMDQLEKDSIDSVSLSESMKCVSSCQATMQALVTNHILEEKKMLTQGQKQRYFKALRGAMSCAGTTMMSGQCDKR
jgi:hypothetical protein